jgi:hypothetical protein
MSKLEDKLSASIKPGRGRKPEPTGTPAAAVPGPAAPPPAAPPAPCDLNDPSSPLHPRRIWPD